MTKLHRKTTNQRLYCPAEDAFMPSPRSERERHMAQFHIGYNGRCHHRSGYRYDRLEDAIAYARLIGSQPGREDSVGAFTQGKTFAWPTDSEHAVMTSLGIRVDNGAYRYESFRCDELADAVNYAKLAPPRQRDDRS